MLDADAFVPPEVVALARWTAEYYAAGAGETIPALLPPMARGGRADAHKTTTGRRDHRRRARGAGRRVEADRRLASRDKQRDALELLAGTPTGIATPALAARGIAADADLAPRAGMAISASARIASTATRSRGQTGVRRVRPEPDAGRTALTPPGS